MRHLHDDYRTLKKFHCTTKVNIPFHKFYEKTPIPLQTGTISTLPASTHYFRRPKLLLPLLLIYFTSHPSTATRKHTSAHQPYLHLCPWHLFQSRQNPKTCLVILSGHVYFMHSTISLIVQCRCGGISSKRKKKKKKNCSRVAADTQILRMHCTLFVVSASIIYMLQLQSLPINAYPNLL